MNRLKRIKYAQTVEKGEVKFSFVRLITKFAVRLEKQEE